MVDVPLKCSCGKVEGVARGVSPNTGNRAICHCDDCQDFAKFLGREEDILNANGGTDIYQLYPYQVNLTKGVEQLRCIHLTPKKLYRWFTACCKTPVGNTISASLPFVGVIHNFMDDEGVRDQNIGPVAYYVQGRFARGSYPDRQIHPKFPIGLTARIIWMFIGGKMRGKNQPSPFYNPAGEPVSEPVVHSAD